MNLKINPHAPLPIYAQIMNEIIALVSTRALLADATLPSVRQLALELEINSLTVQKAYKELEHKGIINIRKGIGATVSADALANIKLDRGVDIFDELSTAVSKMKHLGVSLAEVETVVNKAWNN